MRIGSVFALLPLLIFVLIVNVNMAIAIAPGDLLTVNGNQTHSGIYNYSIKNVDPRYSNIISVHLKNVIRGSDTNIATVDKINQLNNSLPYDVLIHDQNESIITSANPLKLKEGYQLAIKSIDISGNRVYVELSHNGTVVDSKVIIPPSNGPETYNYSIHPERSKNLNIISVHFKNTFAGSDTNIATVDKINQLNNSLPYDVLIHDQNESIITSANPLKLKEGYQLAIKSIDISGNRVYVELSHNGTVVDSKVIIPPSNGPETYNYSTHSGPSKSRDIITVHLKDVIRGSDTNIATVDKINQLNNSPPYHVLLHYDYPIAVTITSANPLKLKEGYQLAIKSIDVSGNKALMELSKNGTVVDSKIIGQNKSIAWYNKGNALYNQGEYDEAIEAYDESIKIDPQDANVWNKKGNALHNQGNYTDAIQAYDRAIELEPKHPVIWNNKAYSLDKLGRYDEAITCYVKAWEIDPTKSANMIDRGDTHYDTGEYAASIKYYDASIMQDPKDKNAWYHKGAALRLLHRNSEADTAFTKARELGYNGTVTIYELGGLWKATT